jgi:hypothetical protein
LTGIVDMSTHGDIIRMREAGFTYQEIADISGLPYGTVRSRLSRWGIQRGHVVLTRNRKAKFDPPYWLIEMMYWDCGLSTNEVAYELDVSKNTLQHWMVRNQVARRSRKEAWALMIQKGNGPAYRPWSTEQARYMAYKAIEVKRRRDLVNT